MHDKTAKSSQKKKWIYFVLFLFLLLMFVMTIVSRIINMYDIPIVQTRRIGSGTIELDAFGKGTVLYGKPLELEYDTMRLDEPVFYIKGYFYDKVHADSIFIGSKVKLFIHGINKEIYGLIVKKIYDYWTDKIEVVVSLDGEDFVSGSEVDFVLEDNRVRYDCHIPKEVVYDTEDGNHYIYVLEERENILGNSTIAVQMEITVLGENEERIAIKEEMDRNSKIIVKDERLKDGIRVREKE